MIGCTNDYVFIDYLSHHEIRVICYKNDQYQLKAVFASKQEAERFAKQWLDFKKYTDMGLGASTRHKN
jgi:hypothetical protein